MRCADLLTLLRSILHSTATESTTLNPQAYLGSESDEESGPDETAGERYKQLLNGSARDVRKGGTKDWGVAEGASDEVTAHTSIPKFRCHGLWMGVLDGNDEGTLKLLSKSFKYSSTAYLSCYVSLRKHVLTHFGYQWGFCLDTKTTAATGHCSIAELHLPTWQRSIPLYCNGICQHVARTRREVRNRGKASVELQQQEGLHTGQDPEGPLSCLLAGG